MDNENDPLDHISYLEVFDEKHNLTTAIDSYFQIIQF